MGRYQQTQQRDVEFILGTWRFIAATESLPHWPFAGSGDSFDVRLTGYLPSEGWFFCWSGHFARNRDLPDEGV